MTVDYRPTSDGNQGESPGPAEASNVYFLSLVDPAAPDRDFERLKVGITKDDVEERIGGLQTGNPHSSAL